MKYTDEHLLKILSEDAAERYKSLSEEEKIEFIKEAIKELNKENIYAFFYKLAITFFLFTILLFVAYWSALPYEYKTIAEIIMVIYPLFFFFVVIPFFHKRGVHFIFNFRRRGVWKADGLSTAFQSIGKR
jgi:uncharacterized membrane protein YkgB